MLAGVDETDHRHVDGDELCNGEVDEIQDEVIDGMLERGWGGGM